MDSADSTGDDIRRDWTCRFNPTHLGNTNYSFTSSGEIHQAGEWIPLSMEPCMQRLKH